MATGTLLAIGKITVTFSAVTAPPQVVLDGNVAVKDDPVVVVHDTVLVALLLIINSVPLAIEIIGNTLPTDAGADIPKERFGGVRLLAGLGGSPQYKLGLLFEP
jgi:hypothetical protein